MTQCQMGIMIDSSISDFLKSPIFHYPLGAFVRILHLSPLSDTRQGKWNTSCVRPFLLFHLPPALSPRSASAHFLAKLSFFFPTASPLPSLPLFLGTTLHLSPRFPYCLPPSLPHLLWLIPATSIPPTFLLKPPPPAFLP